MGQFSAVSIDLECRESRPIFVAGVPDAEWAGFVGARSALGMTSNALAFELLLMPIMGEPRGRWLERLDGLAKVGAKRKPGSMARDDYKRFKCNPHLIAELDQHLKTVGIPRMTYLRCVLLGHLGEVVASVASYQDSYETALAPRYAAYRELFNSPLTRRYGSGRPPKEAV
jgi:hypothetical protein